MDSPETVNVQELFRGTIPLSQEDPRKINFAFLDSNVSARIRMVDALVSKLESLHTNYLVGYMGHMSAVILPAALMNIGFDQLIKVWSKDDPTRMIDIIIDTEKLRFDQSNLGEPLRIVFIDDILNKGIAARFAITELRKSFIIDHAVFLTEIVGGGGREAISDLVKVHSFTTFLLEHGSGRFGPGISPDENLIKTTIAAPLTGPENQSQKRQHHRDYSPWSLNRPLQTSSRTRVNHPRKDF